MSLEAKPVSVILLGAVFALCFYRAATQSFTIDESFTFLRYIETPFRDAVGAYSANNHVLFTLLMKACRWLLGRSELVLRIPSLLGCALYLSAIYFVTELAIRRRWLRWTALAVLTLNPLVLDLLVAARGYGLALGLSWWALYLTWSDLTEPRPGRLWIAGVCAGFVIAANLVFVIPLAILGLLLIPEYARQRRFWQLIDEFAGPAVIVAFVILFLPLSKIQGNEFYFGVAKLSETVASLLGESLWQPVGGLYWLGWLTDWTPSARELVIETIAPAAFAGIALAAMWVTLRQKHRDPQRMLLRLVLWSVVLSVVAWFAMNHWLGVRYPMTRTAVYVLPLLGLGVVLAADTARNRFVQVAFSFGTVLLAMLYVIELRVSYFSEWRSEAQMNRLVKRLIDDAQARKVPQPVTAGGSWDLEYSMGYYRIRYRAGWLKVLGVEERKTESPEYFILGPGDGELVQKLGLRVIDQDDGSGTVLARRT
jgi:hypothetical protein